MAESKVVHTGDPALLIVRRYASVNDYTDPPTGAVVEEVSTGRLFRNKGTPATPVWRELVTGDPYREQFGANSLFGAMGRGDPDPVLKALTETDYARGFYNNVIGTAVGRGVKFRLPRDLSSITAHHWGLAASAASFIDCIYRASDGARMFVSPSAYAVPAANAWFSLTYTGLELKAHTDYWYFIGVTAATAATYMLGPPIPAHNNVFAAGAPVVGRSVGLTEYAQVAVTNGAFPATMPALAPPTNWNVTYAALPMPLLLGTAA